MTKIIDKNYLTLLISIITIFLFETQFFHLKILSKLSVANSEYQKTTLVFIVFMFLSVLLIKIISTYYSFNRIVLFFVTYSFFEMLISLYKYEFNFFSFLNTTSYIFIILCYYIFSLFMKYPHGKRIFLKVLFAFTNITIIIILFQYVFYNKIGLFLNIDSDYLRFGSLRITQSEGIINLSLLLSFGTILDKNEDLKHKIWLWMTFLLCLVDLIFVQKTRFALATISLSLLFMILLKFRRKFIKALLITIVLILLSYLFTKTAIFNEYFQSFTNINEDLSSTIRDDEREFYLDQLYKTPIIGMGFIPLDESSKDYTLNSGLYGIYYKSDVGIIGFSNVFGIIGFLWFATLLLKIGIWLFRRHFISNNYELYGIFIFIILSSWTLIITDPERIIGLPIFLALVDNNLRDYKGRIV